VISILNDSFVFQSFWSEMKPPWRPELVGLELRKGLGNFGLTFGWNCWLFVRMQRDF